MILVVHDPADGTNEASLLALSIDADQTHNLPSVQVTGWALGVGEAHFLDVGRYHLSLSGLINTITIIQGYGLL